MYTYQRHAASTHPPQSFRHTRNLQSRQSQDALIACSPALDPYTPSDLLSLETLRSILERKSLSLPSIITIIVLQYYVNTHCNLRPEGIISTRKKTPQSSRPLRVAPSAINLRHEQAPSISWAPMPPRKYVMSHDCY